MPRNMSHKEHAKLAKSRRDYALRREEFGQPADSPRKNAAGPVSHAVKVNPDAELIERFLRGTKGDK